MPPGIGQLSQPRAQRPACRRARTRRTDAFDSSRGPPSSTRWDSSSLTRRASRQRSAPPAASRLPQARAAALAVTRPAADSPRLLLEPRHEATPRAGRRLPAPASAVRGAASDTRCCCVPRPLLSSCVRRVTGMRRTGRGGGPPPARGARPSASSCRRGGRSEQVEQTVGREVEQLAVARVSPERAVSTEMRCASAAVVAPPPRPGPRA